MRAVWVNDIHLDFLTRDKIDRFLVSIVRESPGVVLVGGDISTAPLIEEHLRRMEKILDIPVCFVLGNHDFYHGSIRRVRETVHDLCDASKNLNWLNIKGVYRLTEETVLVGHDGWGDARLGDYLNSPVELSDFFLIDELRNRSRDELVEILRRLGDEAADHFRDVLPDAFELGRHVVVLTHVPPFRESTWYDGEISNDQWLPFFCCKAAGDVLLEQAEKHPDRTLAVLCGHTHGEGEVQIVPNLKVVTGGAQYGHPRIQGVIEFD
jgi:predicted MPP superfamily phosphohydrolase